MKKGIVAVLALVFSMFLFSCSEDTLEEVDSLYDVEATEGDDGDTPPEPPEEL